MMAGLIIAVCYQGLHASETLHNITKVLLTNDLAGISAIKEAAVFQAKSSRALRDLILAAGDKDEVQDQKQLIGELDKSVDEWIEVAQRALPDVASQTKIAEIRRKLPRLRGRTGQVVDQVVAGDKERRVGHAERDECISQRDQSGHCGDLPPTRRSSQTVGAEV